MLYKESTASYNERRYGRPWIAKLTFVRPGKPEYTFGDWLGNSHGGTGELSIEVEPVDVIATGQKDHRKGRGGADCIGVVLADGKVQWNLTAAQARDRGIEVRAEVEAALTAPVDADCDLLSLGM